MTKIIFGSIFIESDLTTFNTDYLISLKSTCTSKSTHIWFRNGNSRPRSPPCSTLHSCGVIDCNLWHHQPTHSGQRWILECSQSERFYGATSQILGTILVYYAPQYILILHLFFLEPSASNLLAQIAGQKRVNFQYFEVILSIFGYFCKL